MTDEERRVEALRATARIMAGAIDVEGADARNTGKAAAEMAEYLVEWLKTGNR